LYADGLGAEVIREDRIVDNFLSDIYKVFLSQNTSGVPSPNEHLWSIDSWQI